MNRRLLLGSVAAALLQVGSAADAALPAGPGEAPVHALSSGTSDSIDAYVLRTMGAWDIAGLSVAIVKDGETVLAKGYGVRDVRTGEPVDENTIFAIGSMTKSLTAAAAGRLVDRGTVAWDERVVRHVPRFAVGDAYVTGALTIRDALSHRSGFDWSSDALLISAGSRRVLLEGLARLKPVHPFRAGYHYSNVIYIAGSEAVAAAAGMEWETLVQQEVLLPLGMTRSGVSSDAVQRASNVATPHRNLGEDGPRPIARRDIDVAGGAGAVNASASDMARFVRAIADGGSFAGGEFLQKSTIAEMFSPHADIGVQAHLRPFSNFHVSGLGWEVMDYKGHKLALHGGAIDGMLSIMAVVPGERLGIIVLSNTDGARYLPEAVAFTILDHLLGGEQTDWNKPLLARGMAMRKVLYATPDRLPGTSPTLPLEAYAGVYRGPFGAVKVDADDGRLGFTFGELEGALEHWHHDTFRGHFGTYSERLLTFSLDHQRRPSSLAIEFIGAFDRERDAGAGQP